MILIVVVGGWIVVGWGYEWGGGGVDVGVDGEFKDVGCGGGLVVMMGEEFFCLNVCVEGDDVFDGFEIYFVDVGCVVVVYVIVLVMIGVVEMDDFVGSVGIDLIVIVEGVLVCVVIGVLGVLVVGVDV